jgi:DNA-directed RNA polymerase
MGGQKKVRHLNSKDEEFVVLGPKALNALNSVQNIPYEVNAFVLSWIDTIKWEIVERTNNAIKEDGKYRAPSVGKFVPYVKGLSKRASRKTYRTETTIAAANQYSGNVFFHAWLPDYRGRMYPLSSILSPQGTDFEKSLIKFANSGPVNDRAKYWLKIQVANTFGLDKKSFAERVEWVDSNHELISSVATDPIESFDTWSEASEPWTFLAACEEFHSCVITGNRTVTNLPVAVDATCSGIQILSGLTRDSDAAHLVNVSPSDSPQDAYLAVAAKAIELLKSNEPLPTESGNGEPMERVSFESWVHLDRSVAKKVVMTVPYNATADSNASHVSKALRAKGVSLNFKEVNEIVRALRLAVQETLPNAIAFRDWLNGVACLKAKSLDGDAFSWTTPSGVTLVQPIRKWKTVKLDTMVFGRRSQQVIAVEPTDKLNSAKIRTATAPNLIHSLDASILHIACDSLGDEQFTLIHDSVLSLASDMDNVQTALRDAYVAVFGGDIYAEMVELFTPDVTKLKAADKKKLSSPPALGDLDPAVVRDSEYFFS